MTAWIHLGQNLVMSIHSNRGIGVPGRCFMGPAYQKHVHYVYGLFMKKKIQTHKTHMKKIQTHKPGTIAQVNEVCCIHQVDYGLPILLSSNRVVMT